MPVNFPPSSQIYVTGVSEEEEKRNVAATGKTGKAVGGKAYTVNEVRTKHEGAYRPWTTELDDEPTAMYCNGANIADMAEHFERTKGAIRARIKKLELRELHG